MNVDQLTVNWAEEGALKVRELDKIVLSTATSWATIAFLFQEHDGDGSWRAPKVSLRRYRKRGGKWLVDKHLTLSTEKQAVDLAASIQRWFSEEGPGRTFEVQPDSAPSPDRLGQALLPDE